MAKKYSYLYTIVVFALLAQGCSKKDEPIDVEETESNAHPAQKVDTSISNQETPVASVQPGIGVGKVSFGMSFAELKNVLGEPDFDVRGAAYVYSDLGIQILIRDDKVISVICLQEYPDHPEFKPCEYKTAEGIGIGSSESDILAAYNEPSSRRTGRLTYEKLGLAFGIENDQVQMISIELPR